MLNFGESVAVALISAVVALVVSIVFRWLDRERPVWLVTTNGFVEPDPGAGIGYLVVEVTNIGNGAAYDARIMGSRAYNGGDPYQAVLQPGDQMRGLVEVPLRRTAPATDAYGDPVEFYLAGPELRGYSVEVQYRIPPIFRWKRYRLYGLASLASRARTERNDQRELAAVVRKR